MTPRCPFSFWWARSVVLVLAVLSGVFHVRGADRPEPAKGIGFFVALGDIHFDPFLGLTREQFAVLAALPLAEWPSRFAGQPKPVYGADSPFALVQGSLDDAKVRMPEPDFVLMTGDFLAHDWPAKYDQLAVQTRSQDPSSYHAFTAKGMHFLAERLRRAFPRTPILPVLGNEDSDCGDYLLTPNSPFLEKIAEIWSPLVYVTSGEGRGVAERTFQGTVARGGFYSVALPRLPKHRLIALNTVFFAPQYSNTCGDPTATPARDEFHWLEATLELAERDRESVWLLMHLPPGIDSYETFRAGGSVQSLWQPELTSWFLQLVKRYQKVIRFALAGHTHRDDFRLVQFNGEPVLLHKIVPAISPVFATNPGYQIFEYDRPTGQVKDYVTCSLPLASTDAKPVWKVEYRFREAYPTYLFEPASLARLGQELIRGGGSAEAFRTFYSVSGPPTPISASALGCALLYTTVNEFKKCASGPE